MSVYIFDILGRAGQTPSPADGWSVPQALAARPFLARSLSRSKEAEAYQPSPDLLAALNVAIASGRPLLLTGEPGTGKTMAAYFVARRLGLADPIRFQVRSDSRARDLLYEWDAVARLGAGGPLLALEPGNDPGRTFPFAKPGALWRAFNGNGGLPAVLLIDEIDKAPRDFPNDLLLELEEYRFVVEEYPPPHHGVVCPRERIPITLITSNSERRLPEPFLRRCIYHNIDLSPADITRIVQTRVAGLDETTLRSPFLDHALACLLEIRRDRSLDKRPTVDEFWTWLEVLGRPENEKDRARVTDAAARIAAGKPLRLSDLPEPGCLIKSENDRRTLERS